MQGFNMGRYVPPDQEGVVSGNKLLGNRAQKATAAGVPIVRFEMPFAVWCDGCQQQAAHKQPVLIGQGVRFNAEKHRRGKYYSTPIFGFRMRHPPCGTWIEIRTDPKTTSYQVAEGGRKRRQYDDDDDDDDGRADVDPTAAARRSVALLLGEDDAGPAGDDAAGALDREEAFARLEKTIAHREAASTAASRAVQRLDELTAASQRQWQDPYAANSALRAAFRAGRHARETQAAADDDLRARLGGLDSGLRLLPGTDEDARYAAIVDYGRPRVAGRTEEQLALAKPLFGEEEQHSSSSRSTRTRTLASSTQAAKRKRSIRDHLAATVRTNTRLATDPFLQGGWRPPGGGGTGSGLSSSPGPARAAGVKRRRALGEAAKRPPSAADVAEAAEATGDTRRTGTETGAAAAKNTDKPDKKHTAALVNYDSDSE